MHDDVFTRESLLKRTTTQQQTTDQSDDLGYNKSQLLSDLGKPTRHYLAQPPTFASDAQCCQLANERGDAPTARMVKNVLQQQQSNMTANGWPPGKWCPTLEENRGHGDRLGSARAPLTMQHAWCNWPLSKCLILARLLHMGRHGEDECLPNRCAKVKTSRSRTSRRRTDHLQWWPRPKMARWQACSVKNLVLKNSELWIASRVQSACQTFDLLCVARVCNGNQRLLRGPHTNVLVGTNTVQHFAMRDCKHTKTRCVEDERQHNAKPLLHNMRNKLVLSSVPSHAPPPSHTCFSLFGEMLSWLESTMDTPAFHKTHIKLSAIGCGPMWPTSSTSCHSLTNENGALPHGDTSAKDEKTSCACERNRILQQMLPTCRIAPAKNSAS